MITPRLVRQEHSHECGIACIAMIGVLSLDQARAAFDEVYPGARSRGRGVTAGLAYVEVDVVLAELGFAVARLWKGPHENARSPWPPPAFADVHLWQVIGPNGGHYMIVTRDGTVLDPAGGCSIQDIQFVAGVTRISPSMLKVV